MLGTTPQFWLNLQQTYELRVEETNPTLRRQLVLLRKLRITPDALAKTGDARASAAKRRPAKRAARAPLATGGRK